VRGERDVLANLLFVVHDGATLLVNRESVRIIATGGRDTNCIRIIYGVAGAEARYLRPADSLEKRIMRQRMYNRHTVIIVNLYIVVKCKFEP
jgi:hypothetical protein